MDEKSAEHDCGHGCAGDAECQGGDQRGSGVGIVRGLGGGHTFRLAISPCLGSFRSSARLVVGHERRHRTAGTGKNADPDTDERGAYPGLPEASHARQGLPDRFGAELAAVHTIGLQRCLEQVDHRWQGIEADEQDDDVDAVEDLQLAESVAIAAKDGIGADHRDEHAEAGADEPLERVSSQKKDDARKAEDGDPEHLGRAEQQRYLGEWRGEQHQREGAGDTADGRRDDRYLQGKAAFALLRHGVAVEGGGDSGRRAGNAQEHGRNSATIHRTIVDARHQAEGDQRFETEGEGNEHRDRHRGAEAGHGADDNAGDDTDDDSSEVGEAKDARQCVEKIGVHGFLTSARGFRTGSPVPSRNRRSDRSRRRRSPSPVPDRTARGSRKERPRAERKSPC